MRENAKEQELLKGFRLEILFINRKVSLLQCLYRDFIAKPPLQITKKYKSKHYYLEKVGRKPKSEQKVKKSNGQQE